MKHEPYILDECKIRISNVYGADDDTAYSMEIPVLVEFEYDRDPGELPQVRKLVVKIAQDWTFGADYMELVIRQGRDITNFVTVQQADRIEQEIHKRYAAHAADENEAALEHEASQRKAEREAP